MGNGKLSKFPIIFFSVGVVLNCLFFSTTVLDYTLTPRIVFLSFFILIFFTYLLFFFKGFHLSIDFIILPYLLFILFVLISNFWSLNTSLSIIASSKQLLSFFILMITYKLLDTYKEDFLSLLLKTILILFFISLIQAIVQLIGLQEISRHHLYSISGISSHKNLYSGFVFLCSIFSCIGFFRLRSYWKSISLFAIACQLFLIVFIQTRAVWIGYIVFFGAGLLILLVHKKIKVANYKHITICIISALILLNTFLVYVLPHLLKTYHKHEPSSYNVEKVNDLTSFSERVLIWEKTYAIFKDHPFAGVGGNNWQLYFPSSSLPDLYRVKDLNVTFQRPHNDFLWILSEYGLPGFNLFFLFIIMLFFFLLFRLLNHFDISYVIILSGILGFLSFSFFDFPKERIEHTLLFSILLGIIYYLVKQETNKVTTHLFYIPKFILHMLVVVFVIVLYCSFLNFKGEYFTKKMYVERIKNNNKEVINLCNNAQSFCYTLDPTSVPLAWYRGNANANLKNYSTAFTDFKNAFHQHPYNHCVLNDLGSAYFMNNSIDSAKMYYMESARINPRFDEPKLNLTAIYINEDNYKEAEKWNESIFHDSKRRTYYRNIINDHRFGAKNVP